MSDTSETTSQRSVKPTIIRMNAKLKVLLFTIVLLASVVTHGEGFSSAHGGVGRKRSTKQLSEENNVLPLREKSFRLPHEDHDVVRVRRDQLCDFAKRTC